MMFVYIFCLSIFTPVKSRWQIWLIALVLLAFMYFSSSRTGLVTAFLGASTALFLKLKSADTAATTFARLSKSKLLASLLLLVIFVAATDFVTNGQITEKMVAFVAKQQYAQRPNSSGDFSFDIVIRSREGQIDRMMENIEDHWVAGIGFGVGSSQQAFAQRAGLTSASTEKGVLPVAIVEETGILGTFFFVLFISVFIKSCLRSGNQSGLTLFAALLGANLGEMMFFSFGGQGAFMWLFVAAGFANLSPKSDAWPNAQVASPHPSLQSG